MKTRAQVQREYLEAVCGAKSGVQCAAFEKLCNEMWAIGYAEGSGDTRAILAGPSARPTLRLVAPMVPA